jgi:hypothetical protein
MRGKRTVGKEETERKGNESKEVEERTNTEQKKA